MIQRNGLSKAESLDTVRAKRSQESSDLRHCLKTVSDTDEVTLDGKLFHMHEAVTGNARSPLVEWRISSTTSVDVDADLRCHRESLSVLASTPS